MTSAKFTELKTLQNKYSYLEKEISRGRANDRISSKFINKLENELNVLRGKAERIKADKIRTESQLKE